MATTPNPPGMHRRPLDDGHPPYRYQISDGDQVVGETERVNRSKQEYWRAHPAGGSPAPRHFPEGRHQEEAMLWLRDPWAAA
jgi:hypothetical protein